MSIKTQTFTGGAGGSITGGLEYKGTFNATTGLPSLANAEQGDYYKIATGGTIYGQTWNINDSLLINADMGGTIINSKIDKIDNTEPTNVLITTNNLSDLDNAGTARTNLGLGNVATLTTGVSNGNVIVADSTGLPAIDGSQLTGVTATDSTKLAIANNLSDLNSASTARTNLGLGNVATLTTGVSNGNVIVADSTGLPAIDGSQLTGITATDSTKLAIANNLSDLNSASTARTNLGLGNVATLTTGVSNGNVIVADSTGLPAIDGSQLTGITATDSTKLAIANNLSDLNSASTARTNLGLGNVATLTTGVSNGNVIVADSTGLPAIDGSQLTGITATDSTKLAIANNLSDLNSASTARTNLGLGNVATLTTGVSNGNVIVADSTGLPAIDGSQLTGVTATDSTKLAIANNLSDLNNATTARTNLGLGNVATLTTGVSNGNVIVADSTGLPAIDGSQLTGVTATDSTKLAIANNLSDLNNATTARTNLGLGNVATLTTGVANGNVIVADSTGLPAIDGSQLTGVTATDSTKLAIANNLSDLNNATTARTNLGLGTASTSATTDFLSATGADSLGGDLDTNDHELISNSNKNVTIRPNGTGIVKLGGNTNPAELRFYCETTDQHYIGFKAPTHSELSGKSSISWRLPLEDASSSGDALISDGSGNLSFATISGGGSAPTVTSASPGSNYTISTHADNEEIYLLTPSTDISVLLPSASSCGSGYKYQIKNLSTNTLTIDPNGSETIDTSATFAISDQYTSITLVTDGSNWFII